MKKLILVTAAVLVTAAACSSGSTATTGTTAGSPGSVPSSTAGGSAPGTAAVSTGSTFVPSGVPTYGKDDLAITTSVSKHFAIELESNPSTGYSWTYTQVGSGLTLVTEVKPTSGGAPGSGGTQRFVFLATTPGASFLDFTYARSNPGPDDTKLRFDVTID